VTAGVTAWFVRARVDFIPALLAVVMGLACVTGSLLARPHMLTLPLPRFLLLLLLKNILAIKKFPMRHHINCHIFIILYLTKMDLVSPPLETDLHSIIL
jgi:hypothetical protein